MRVIDQNGYTVKLSDQLHLWKIRSQAGTGRDKEASQVLLVVTSDQDADSAFMKLCYNIFSNAKEAPCTLILENFQYILYFK